jgi:hypothetical protein
MLGPEADEFEFMRMHQSEYQNRPDLYFILYKYKPLNDFLWKTLETSEMWFSHYSKLNDEAEYHVDSSVLRWVRSREGHFGVVRPWLLLLLLLELDHILIRREKPCPAGKINGWATGCWCRWKTIGASSKCRGTSWSALIRLAARSSAKSPRLRRSGASGQVSGNLSGQSWRPCCGRRRHTVRINSRTNWPALGSYRPAEET